jgi:hypothetical protein
MRIDSPHMVARLREQAVLKGRGRRRCRWSIGGGYGTFCFEEVVSTHLGDAGDVFGTKIGVAPQLCTSRLE